jgi:hypothetical protein
VFGSETLDAAIGLVFLFLLLSLVCSSIQEALETVLRYRARDLHRGISEMLSDKNNTALVTQLYQHPLINGLYQGSYDPKNLKNLPSYIPPRTFSLALVDLLHPAHTQPPSPAGLTQPNLVANPKLQLRTAVAATPNESVRRALLPLIDSAGDDLEAVRRNIENWYDAVMDRVSGWYKRRTQITIAFIGLALAAFMNVDTIGVARYLNTSETIRSVIVARAQAERNSSTPSNYDLIDPLGWLERQGGVPVGWVFAPEKGEPFIDFERDWRRLPDTSVGWMMKLAGILLTTFSVSLGAPFWFDVLNRFMVVRSTVKPDEKSKEEKSKS